MTAELRRFQSKSSARLQRSFGDLPDVRRTAVESALLACFELEPELRRDHDSIAEWGERFADELFVGERPIGFSGIEEGDAAFNRRSNQRDALLLLNRRSVAKAESHAAEPERRDFQAAVAKFAGLHHVLPSNDCHFPARLPPVWRFASARYQSHAARLILRLPRLRGRPIHMPRLAFAIVAAVFTWSAHAVVAFDRSNAAADNAWLIVVDDLHIDFVQTGRLRTLLRAVASELVRDGDVYQILATGPSATTPLTADLDLLAPALRAATGNGLKAVDTVAGTSGSPASNEVLYRANVALDAAHDALIAFAAGDGLRKAIIFVSLGYDVDTFPALSDRVIAFARRAREDGIAIFAIDARGFASLPLLDPRVDSDAWLRHRAATRLSLTMMAEQAGGFVIEKIHEPMADLQRINARMR